MIDIIAMACLGIVGGVFTGIVPGIHPNTLAALIVSAGHSLLSVFSPEAVAVFIVASAVSHTFLSYVPSVFIGAPESGTALSVLPGHSLLLEGRGHEAVYLTVVGGIGVMVLSAALLPVLIYTIPVLYSHMKVYMGWLLLGIAGTAVLTERGVKRFYGALCFLLAGIMGVVVLETPLLPSHLLLFPVFTGMFGISTLVFGLNSGASVPRQTLDIKGAGAAKSLAGVVKGFFSGLLVGIMPGVGAAQAGMLTHIMSRGERRGFLISLGGINTVAALFSLVALYVISRPRSGAAIAVQGVLETFGFRELVICVGAGLFAAGVAAIVTLRTSRVFASVIGRINYAKLSWATVVFLVVMAGWMTGAVGVLLLGVSSAIGMLAPLLGVKRSHCMGVLVLPVMMWFFSM